MKKSGIGRITLIIGIIMGIYALNMDTSREVTAPSFVTGQNETIRVNNFGLMNEKTNYLIFSGILSLIGVVLLAIPVKKEIEPETEVKQDIDAKKYSEAEELKKWHDLKVAGAITEAEFEEKKRQLIIDNKKNDRIVYLKKQ